MAAWQQTQARAPSNPPIAEEPLWRITLDGLVERGPGGRTFGNVPWMRFKSGGPIEGVTDLGSKLVCYRCSTRYAGVSRVGFCFLVREADLLHVTRGPNGQNIVHGWWCFGILGLRELLRRNSEGPWESRGRYWLGGRADSGLSDPMQSPGDSLAVQGEPCESWCDPKYLNRHPQTSQRTQNPSQHADGHKKGPKTGNNWRKTA